MASVHLEVNEYQAPPKPPNTSTDIFFHVDIEQTAAGLTSTQERRCIDGEWRPHNDWLFGDVKGKTEWLSLNDLDDDFLKQGWEPQSDDPTAKNYIVSHVESQTNGWTARQVWGFQIVDGLRRYTRAIVVTKGSERVAVHLYYDYLGSA